MRVKFLFLLIISLCWGMNLEGATYSSASDSTVTIIQPEGLGSRMKSKATPEPKPEVHEKHKKPVVSSPVTSGDAKKVTPGKNPKKEVQAPRKKGEVGYKNYTKPNGYRVQIFSDNNQRTAKNEARSRQRAIAGRFSRHRTYVSYSAPYWRTRIGDFETQEEAQALANQIKRAFPQFRKEIRVVKDKVTIVEE